MAAMDTFKSPTFPVVKLQFVFLSGSKVLTTLKLPSNFTEVLESSKGQQKEALAVMRDWANPKDSPSKDNDGVLAKVAKKRLAKLKAKLEEALPEDNVIYIK